MLGVVGQQCCVRLHGAFLKKLSMHIRSCCSQISSAFLQQFSSFLQKILSFGYKGKDTALNLCTSVQSYTMYLLINNSDFFTTLLQTSLAWLVSFRNILIGHVMIFQRTVSFKFQWYTLRDPGFKIRDRDCQTWLKTQARNYLTSDKTHAVRVLTLQNILFSKAPKVGHVQVLFCVPKLSTSASHIGI